MCVAFRICLTMAEAESPLNKPGLLTCLSKTKHGWISLKYAWIFLKYNVKDPSRYSRRDGFRTVSTSKIEVLWKCLIWYYRYTIESEYALR